MERLAQQEIRLDTSILWRDLSRANTVEEQSYMMSSLHKLVILILTAAISGCNQMSEVHSMSPASYNSKTIYDGSSYRLTLMTPEGMIGVDDPLVRYRFGIVKLDNISDRHIQVSAVELSTYLGAGYRANIGDGSDRQNYEVSYEQAQAHNLTGKDDSGPIIVPPGYSVRLSSYGVRSVLAALGAFGSGEEGRPLVPLDRICPEFSGSIGVQVATPQGKPTGEFPTDGIATLQANGLCYGVDFRRDWASDWNASYHAREDAYPDWEPYPTP